MELERKTLMVVLLHPVVVGQLEAILEAQIFIYPEDPERMDIEFIDILDIEYMGISVGDWRKFVEKHKEYGIDFDSWLNKKFDEVFSKEAVKEYLKTIDLQIKIED